MQKYRILDIKNYEFSDLQNSHEASESDFRPFSFVELNGSSVKGDFPTEEGIRAERSFEKKNNFTIDGIVRQSRGHHAQENSDFQQKVNSEVEIRLKKIEHDAYAEGLEKGRLEGRERAFSEFEKNLSGQLDDLASILASVKTESEKLLLANRSEVLEFVKRFSKWIVLKEIDEKNYLDLLLEKLILELNSRKNIIIKVGQKNFSQMPDIIQKVESRVGQLINVRVEIVPELKYPGIILESENGLINGSLEGVFSNIDQIFQQLNLQEHRE
jgi:flagellar assembly protein FliH